MSKGQGLVKGPSLSGYLCPIYPCVDTWVPDTPGRGLDPMVLLEVRKGPVDFDPSLFSMES